MLFFSPRRSILSTLALAALVLVTQIPALIPALPIPSNPPAHGAAPHWDYSATQGPTAWGYLSPQFSKCLHGTRQSPVDLGLDPTVKTIPTSPFQYAFTPTDLHVTHNGHTLNFAPVEGKPRPTFTRGYQTYEMLQMHIHTPSEHRVKGVHSDLELHIVGKEQGGEGLVVHGVMYNVAPGQNDPGTAFWRSVPKELPTAPAEAKGYDTAPEIIWKNAPLDQLLADLNNFSDAYTYTGSLTTPPCTESVEFVVSKRVLNVCVGTFLRLRSVVGYSAREVHVSGVSQAQVAAKGADTGAPAPAKVEPEPAALVEPPAPAALVEPPAPGAGKANPPPAEGEDEYEEPEELGSDE